MADDELNPPNDEPAATSSTGTGKLEATMWKALPRKHEKAAKENATPAMCGASRHVRAAAPLG